MTTGTRVAVLVAVWVSAAACGNSATEATAAGAADTSQSADASDTAAGADGGSDASAAGDSVGGDAAANDTQPSDTPLGDAPISDAPISDAPGGDAAIKDTTSADSAAGDASGAEVSDASGDSGGGMDSGGMDGGGMDGGGIDGGGGGDASAVDAAASDTGLCPLPQPPGTVCEGSYWVCAKGYFHGYGKTDCVEATCANMKAALDAALAEVTAKAHGCSGGDDGECVVISTSTACQGSCGAAVNGGMANDVALAVGWVDEHICKAFAYADKCGFSTPKCMPPAPACVDGVCVYKP